MTSPLTHGAQPELTETLLFELGLLTPDQLGELLREAVRSGRTAESLALERGWVTDEQLVEALHRHDPAPAPAPAWQPVLVSPTEQERPAAEPEAHVVTAILSTGASLELDVLPSRDAAEAARIDLAARLTAGDAWLPVAGTLVRSSAIVALDVHPRTAA